MYWYYSSANQKASLQRFFKKIIMQGASINNVMSEDDVLMKETFLMLPQPKDKVQCQYVWIDGSLRNLRTKSQTLSKVPQIIQELPILEFCGSATDFDVGNEADYYSHPTKIYRDPFRRNDNRLIFCETRTREGLPTFANNRHRLRLAQEKSIASVSEFNFYQPYTLMRSDGKPLSYLKEAYSLDSKSGFLCGKELAESHYRACLYAGVKICCMEPVSNQGQWKYGIGPQSSVCLGDDVWMSRYLLVRVAEDFGVSVSFDSSSQWSCLKPISADVDFSTEHLTLPQRQKIIDDLYAKFGVNEKPLKIVTPKSKVILKGINSNIDPYSKLTRLLETLSHLNYSL